MTQATADSGAASDLAILIKSYRGDFPIAERLLASVKTFNTDSLPVYVVVPQGDLDLFSQINLPGMQIIAEEEFADHLVTEPFGGMTTGYINQQIVKLTCWERIEAHNFLVLDSDVEIIRPFSAVDFLAKDGYPYSVLVQDKEMLADPHYFDEQWRTRADWLRVITEEMAYPGPWPLRTCHANTVFNSRVLESLRDDFMQARGWTYADLLKVAPYEFSWYNTWLQVSNIIPVRPCEPWIRTYHSEHEHLSHLASDQTLDDLRRAYVGISVQSNFARHKDLPATQTSKPEVLGRYLSYGEYVSVGVAKVRDTWSRRFGSPKS